MRHIHKNYFVPTLIILLFTSVNISTVSAQQATSNYMQVEPARWTQEDVTLQQQYSTAYKEATNAQQQFLDECKTLPTNQRNDCIASVRLTYNQEMAAIRLKFKK